MDQSAGMLDDGAKEQGLALLCISKPCSDCKIQIIEEVGSFSPYSEALHCISCCSCWKIPIFVQDEVLEAMLCSSENV